MTADLKFADSATTESITELERKDDELGDIDF